MVSARMHVGYDVLADGTVTEAVLRCMDVNRDGSVDSVDAMLVLRYSAMEAAGLEPEPLGITE